MAECFETATANRDADQVLRVSSFISFGVAALLFVADVLTPRKREWPKRVVTCFGFCILLVESAVIMGAATNFRERKAEGGEPTTLCLAQGIVYHFSLNVGMLLFLCFQLSQWLMLCRAVPSERIRRFEPAILLFIVVYGLANTALSAALHKISAEDGLYWCWVHGWSYFLFSAQLACVTALSIFWSAQVIRWIRRVKRTLVHRTDNNQESCRALDTFLFTSAATMGLCVAFVAFVFFTILYEPRGSKHVQGSVCYMKSYQVVCFPFGFLLLSRGSVLVEGALWLKHRCLPAATSTTQRRSFGPSTSSTSNPITSSTGDGSGCSGASAGSGGGGGGSSLALESDRFSEQHQHQHQHQHQQVHQYRVGESASDGDSGGHSSDAALNDPLLPPARPSSILDNPLLLPPMQQPPTRELEGPSAA
jgi:uncharacterized membrane protein YgcG